jgi:ankyrin repeat protein
LARSQESEEKILWKFPHAINERNVLSQTPLHLSADWIWGTIRLLAAGGQVDIPNRSVYPIYYACEVLCSALLDALLASDSPINLPWKSQNNRLGLFGSSYGSLPPHIFEKLCNALAERRKQLADLAKRVLSATEYKKLFGSSTGLLDSMAEEMCQAIADARIQISSALEIPYGRFTVYHTRKLTTEEMQKLYNAGFHDVDTLDSSGETPFMVAARYMHEIVADICKWLILKGANPLKEVTDFGTVQIHHLATAMANLAMRTIQYQHFNRQGSPLSRVTFPDLESAIKLISRDSYLMVRDQCNCGCSPFGCSSIAVFLKNTFSQVYEDPLEKNQSCSRCHYREHIFPEIYRIHENCV